MSKYFNQLNQSTIVPKRKSFFIISQKNIDIITVIFLKKLVSFLAMVRLRYTPNEDDLSLSIFLLLRRIWNMSTHSDKREHVDLIIYEEWAVEYLKKKWEDDFLDFETSIKKIQKNDETFINFNEIHIFGEKILYDILRSK